MPIALLMNICLAIYPDNILLMGKKVRKNFNEERYFHFFALVCGFCHKSEKVSSKTISPDKEIKN